jgi:tetratricopeptide (TPR) repeat protein
MSKVPIDFRIAETREDLEGALHLVYENYIDKKYCQFNIYHMHIYLFDVQPQTRTLVAVQGNVVLGTLMLVFDSGLGLPSDKLYKTEFDGLRANGRRIAEISKLSMGHVPAIQHLIILRGLFRLAWLLTANVRQMTDFCILIEPHHEGFYCKQYNFERIGEERADASAGDASSLLLRLNLETARERLRETAGASSSIYRYHTTDPAVTEVEAAASASDRRLEDLNARVSSGSLSEATTPEEHQYMSLRMFSIGFNTNKVREEAARKEISGDYSAELNQFERLLTVLPASFLPEQRAAIYTNMAFAAFHCGLYEKVLTLSEDIRRSTIDAERSANSFHFKALALHFLGKRNEAVLEINLALEMSGISPFMRAKLLRMDARFAIDRGLLDWSARRMDEALEVAQQISDKPSRRKLMFHLLHDKGILQRRRGNIEAAHRILEDEIEYIDEQFVADCFIHHQTLGGILLEERRPAESLEHTLLAATFVEPGSNPFNGAVLIHEKALAYLVMGDLLAAQRELELAFEYARRAGVPNAMAPVLCSMMGHAVASDDLGKAQEVLVHVRQLFLRDAQQPVQALAFLIEGDWAVHEQRFLECPKSCGRSHMLECSCHSISRTGSTMSSYAGVACRSDGRSPPLVLRSAAAHRLPGVGQLRHKLVCYPEYFRGPSWQRECRARQPRHRIGLVGEVPSLA